MVSPGRDRREPCHSTATSSNATSPQSGHSTASKLAGAAKTSNEALAKLGAEIQCVESFVAGDKTFCVYLAKDEDVIRKHSELSGFPANKITPIVRTIDPTTERGA